MIESTGLASISVSELRARAAQHQRAIDMETKYLSPAMLAARWGCSRTSVTNISIEKLPYMPVGEGLKNVHRRYHPDDVAAYEAAYRAPGKRAVA